jgi:hypothetical protein
VKSEQAVEPLIHLLQQGTHKSYDIST